MFERPNSKELKVIARLFYATMRRAVERLALLILFLLAFTVCPGESEADSGTPAKCPSSILDWLQVQLQRPTPGSNIQDFAKWQKVEYETKVSTAKSLYAEYQSHQLNHQNFERCLENLPNAQSLLFTLQSVFYDQSIAQLHRSRSSAVQNFLKMIDANNLEGSQAMFRLTGHFKEESPTELKGGFHRATGSIFMDFSRISPSEWFLIFSHEMIHNLDEKLWIGVKNYSKSDAVKEFANWSKDRNLFTDLTEAEQKGLSEWIDAGLDRGLWAEYRAWVATFAIYEQAVDEGLWSKVDWMEQIRKGWNKEIPFNRYLYDFLDSQSADPKVGIFSRPLIQDALRTERARYRGKGAPLPRLGNLEFIR